jgi:hypothetical protein
VYKRQALVEIAARIDRHIGSDEVAAPFLLSVFQMETPYAAEWVRRHR